MITCYLSYTLAPALQFAFPAESESTVRSAGNLEISSTSEEPQPCGNSGGEVIKEREREGRQGIRIASKGDFRKLSLNSGHFS